MKNFAIATTLLFAAIAAHSPQHLLPASFITCISYMLVGFELFLDKRYKEEIVEIKEPTEIENLQHELMKTELAYKINETERQNSLRTEAHVRKQKQEKLMENGIGW